VTFTVTDSSSPALSELTGTVFAIGKSAAVERAGGKDRIRTAVAVSRAAFPEGTADAVVLARADLFADALAGGPLAAEKRGPLLLTRPGALHVATRAEIERVLPQGGTVYLLGRTGALSAKVATAVEDLGYRVRRVGGRDRYATAVTVAKRLGSAEAVFLANGRDFPDALAASSAAAHLDGVVLLTNGSSMAGPSATYLGRHPQITTYAIGGPAAAAAPEAEGIVGRDRYATAALTARQLFTSPSEVGLASGVTFPDALTAVGQLGRLDAPILLTKPGALPASTSTYLSEVKATLRTIHVHGGTAAVSGPAADQAQSATR
jgi:putative cell wall-binding protein